MNMTNKDKNTPSLFRMIKSFTKDLAKYIKDGSPNVSPEDYAIRLDICGGCEHLKKSFMRCGKCGCLVEHKAKWKTTDCPDTPSKWPKQEQPPKVLGTDPSIANRSMKNEQE